MKIVTDLIVKSAHKEYDCDACKIIINAFGSIDRFIYESIFKLNLQQTISLKLAKSYGSKILIGDSYRKLFYVDDNGKLVTFRGLTDIEKICKLFDITQEVTAIWPQNKRSYPITLRL